MALPGRKFSSGGEYRFGFNGKENDDETGTQDYGMRIYDTRIAKFLSVDPLSKDYPWYTPYQFAGNKPIRFVDLDGAEEHDPMRADDEAYLAGKMSEQTLRERRNARGIGAIIGVVTLVDIFITRGKIFQTVMAYDLGTGVEFGEKSLNAKNRGDYAKAKEYSEKSKEAYLSFGIGIGTSAVVKIFGKIVRTVTSYAKVKVNIYGEGETAGFKDYATDPAWVEGTNGSQRPLTTELQANSVDEFVMNSSPLNKTTVDEALRTAKEGANFKYTVNADGSNKAFENAKKLFGDKAKDFIETTTKLENPYVKGDFYEVKTLEFTIKKK